MRAVIATLLLAAATPAFAAWPSDISISAMATHQGQPIDAPATDAFRDLVRSLGAGMSSYSALPANTTGIDGFDVAVGSTVWFTDTRSDSGPTGWELSHADGKPNSYQFSPSLIARKGLPFSTEIGAGTSWFGGSSQGAVHAFARAALLEGHLPWPSVTLQAGYTAYVGNDELELGIMDLSATLGTTLPIKRFSEATNAHISPFLTVGMLRMRAQAVVDDEIAEAVGTIAIGGPDRDEAALTALRLQTGLQVNSGPALFRFNAAWTPGTPFLVAASTGIGF